MATSDQQWRPGPTTALEKARFAREAVAEIRSSVISFAAPLGMASLLTAVEVLAEAVEELAQKAES